VHLCGGESPAGCLMMVSRIVYLVLRPSMNQAFHQDASVSSLRIPRTLSSTNLLCSRKNPAVSGLILGVSWQDDPVCQKFRSTVVKASLVCRSFPKKGGSEKSACTYWTSDVILRNITHTKSFRLMLVIRIMIISLHTNVVLSCWHLDARIRTFR
jgi:hypothetical protein